MILLKCHGRTSHRSDQLNVDRTFRVSGYRRGGSQAGVNMVVRTDDHKGAHYWSMEFSADEIKQLAVSGAEYLTMDWASLNVLSRARGPAALRALADQLEKELATKT